VSIHLWKAQLPKQERKEICSRLRAILNTCRSSALKHLADGDAERLRWRINKTLTDLKQLAKELVEDGLTAAAKFLRAELGKLHDNLRKTGDETDKHTIHKQPHGKAHGWEK